MRASARSVQNEIDAFGFDKFFGAPIDGAALKAQAPAATASLAAHMASLFVYRFLTFIFTDSKVRGSLPIHTQNIIDNQLSDGREWLLGTVSPSLADISIFFILKWIKERDVNEVLFDKSRFPYAVQVCNLTVPLA